MRVMTVSRTVVYAIQTSAISSPRSLHSSVTCQIRLFLPLVQSLIPSGPVTYSPECIPLGVTDVANVNHVMGGGPTAGIRFVIITCLVSS